MNFLFFLWNSFARIINFFFFIFAEILVFSLLVSAITAAGMPILAGFLTFIFIIWIIIDIILKVFVGGGKTLIGYIFNR